jgi:hypothetical protein
VYQGQRKKQAAGISDDPVQRTPKNPFGKEEAIINSNPKPGKEQNNDFAD